MVKVFIDVGGYHGESSLAALDPIFGFDRIFCFEPVLSCADIILRRIVDKRFVLVQACLSNQQGTVTIHNPGTVAASVYSDAPSYEGTAPPETVVAIDASSFFRTFVRTGDQVWMKLNCEGSECDVLESLLDARVCNDIQNVLVDFDARKIPSQRHRVSIIQQRLLRERLPHSLPEDVQYGNVTNYGGIRNWLLLSGAKAPGPYSLMRSLGYNIRVVIRYPQVSGYHKMKLLKMFPFLSVFAKSRRRKAVPPPAPVVMSVTRPPRE
jgi:FkbM family methyltransferase